MGPPLGKCKFKQQSNPRQNKTPAAFIYKYVKQQAQTGVKKVFLLQGKTNVKCTSLYACIYFNSRIVTGGYTVTNCQT